MDLRVNKITGLHWTNINHIILLIFRFDRGSGDQASFDRAARERNDRPVLREDRREGEFHRRSRSRDRSDTRVSRGRDEHRNERSHHTSPPRHTDNRDWKNERGMHHLSYKFNTNYFIWFEISMYLVLTLSSNFVLNL